MNHDVYTTRILLPLVPTSWLKIVNTACFFPSLFLFPSFTSYRFFLDFVLLLCFEFLLLTVFVFKGRLRTKQDANGKNISADEEVSKNP